MVEATQINQTKIHNTPQYTPERIAHCKVIILVKCAIKTTREATDFENPFIEDHWEETRQLAQIQKSLMAHYHESIQWECKNYRV